MKVLSFSGKLVATASSFSRAPQDFMRLRGTACKLCVCIASVALVIASTGCPPEGPGGGGAVEYPAPKAPQTYDLVLGDDVELVEQEVGPEGGAVSIDKEGDPLNGMRIDVPSGAFDRAVAFEISYAPIEGFYSAKEERPFTPAIPQREERPEAEENLEPLTPLITIKAGSRYAEAPLTLRVPIDLPEESFALGFYYDKKTKTLEGLPLAALDAESITLVTRHFSDVLVGSISNSELDRYIDRGIDSGFTPGVDDWQFTNYGSVLAPGGHCAGQSISAMWYYSEKRLRGEPPLFGLWDNNGDAGLKTPDFWQDDAWGYKLASTVQTRMRWNDRQAQDTRALSEQSPLYAWRAFAYSMLMTGKPQFISVYTEAVGHALVAYRIEEDTLYVADPNFPGSDEREIKFSGGGFQPYNSGDTAASLGTLYTKFHYVANSALVDWSDVEDWWDDIRDGEDFFPEYELKVVTPGGEFDPDDTIRIDANSFSLRVDAPDADTLQNLQVSYYLADEGPFPSNPTGDAYPITFLRRGENKVGVWLRSNGSWLGFHRLTVVSGEESEAPSEDDTVEADEQQIRDIIDDYAESMTKRDAGLVMICLVPDSPAYEEYEKYRELIFENDDVRFEMLVLGVDVTEVSGEEAQARVELKITNMGGMGGGVTTKTYAFELRDVQGRWKIYEIKNLEEALADSAGGEPSEEDKIEAVIRRNAEGINKEDLEMVMDCIDRDSPFYYGTRQATLQGFLRYNVKLEILSIEIQELKEFSAEVKTVQKMTKISGPAFRDNVATVINSMRETGDAWKIYSTEVLDVEYLDEGAVEETQPPQVIEKGGLDYPERAKAEGVEGLVTLRLEINEDGSVGEITITSEDPGGYGFAEAARRHAETYRFSPAARDGRPIRAFYDLTVRFQREPGGGCR